ncbi:hypothetical protein ABIE45_003753 [Methylobacterium sp. OAE515]
MTGNDRIIQNAQQAIQRSRKSLEQTKHQVHPGTGGAYLGINPAGAHAAGIGTSSVRSRNDVCRRCALEARSSPAHAPRRELPDRNAPGLTRLRPAAGEAVEDDPVGLDSDHRPFVHHQGAGIFDAQEAVLRMHAEQLRGGSAEPVRLSAMLVEEGQRVLPHRGPLRRREIPARRGVLEQTLDLVALGGDGGREVGHAGGVGPNGCRPANRPRSSRSDLLTGWESVRSHQRVSRAATTRPARPT